ncbi:MAG: 16S rRNA (cytosine(1402)-N(4))-methyltransferase RsmH [Phycisphaerales bacterium]
MTPPTHIPVLLHEVVTLLDPTAGSHFVDCTAGLGGHASTIAQAMGTGSVTLFDADPDNLSAATARVSAAAPKVSVTSHHANFAHAPRLLAAQPADMVLADLGFSSNQMDTPSRGFSFRYDAPLDMRLDPTLPTTAADLVASLPERELTRLIEELGEDRAASRIAGAIVRARRTQPLTTTAQLADVVRSVIPKGDSPIDPATRTFQALRIAVNDELGVLQALLDAVIRAADALEQGKPSWLRPGARVAIVSFHSLEDRAVKKTFGEIVRRSRATGNNRAQELSCRPTVPTENESAANPRARSAKLRVVRLSL